MTTSPGEQENSDQSTESAGYIDDSQLPEDLRPDAEGLTPEDRVGGGPDGDNAAGPTGQVAEPLDGSTTDQAETTDGDTGVSEPTA